MMRLQALNKRYSLRLGTTLALGLLAASVTLQGFAWAEDPEPEEEPAPTPLQEFAPDEIRPSRNERYDQALTIQRIEIEGNRLIKDEKIRENMVIRPGSLYSKNHLKDDLRRIYDMGYFTEKLKAVPISTNSGIVLRIVVQENAPVTGVNIEGNTLISDTELQEIFASQTGLPQNIGQLNESIEKVEKLYTDKGYVLARVTDIQDDPDGVINLKINEGVIDKVQFVGNRKTKDFVIKRAMVTQEGKVYNEKVLSEDLKRIFSSQAFSDVRRVITASPDNPDQYNLTVEVDEKRTGSISLGGGVDTGTGLFGSLGYSDPNFLGRGQNLSSIFAVGSGVLFRNNDTQARARNYQFDVGWSDPSFMQSDNSLSANLYGRDYASLNVPLGVERRIGGEVAWGRPLASFKNTSFGLSLRGENVNLRDYADDDDLAEFGITDDERDEHMKGGTFVSLSPTIAFDTRNNRFEPTSGWLNTFSLTGAYGLSEGGSYGLATANLRRYIKIRDGITLALNAQGGHSLLGDVPAFNMYRLGGTYSVRGFQEGGLGIGNGFLMSSAEVRTKIPFKGKLAQIPVLNSLSTVFFADAGTLVGESDLNDQFNRSGLGASIGTGIRINMPGVGPIRIDYALPIAGKNDYTRRINFGVGQKF